MIRIAVVDDNESDLKIIKNFLRRYEKEKRQEFDIRVFYDGEDLIAEFEPGYGMVLLDIQMAGMDGMKAAQTIREKDEYVPVIFITNMPQYAIEGYKVRALDYMLKPVSWPSFSETITRALRYTDHPETGNVVILRKDGMRKLNVSRICYVEVRDHLLYYHTPEGVFESGGTMQDAQEQLSSLNFFRIHRCYLVNLKWVDSCSGNDVTVAGDTLILSRNRRKPFLDALNCYINEVHA